MSAWTVRQATAGDRDAAVALLIRAHAGDAAAPFNLEAWNWLYLENPAGAGMQYLVADAGETLAGQYATLPVRLRLDGQDRQALLSLDTATDPAFQRQGIFVTLADRLYRDATPNFALVYGFPNERSAHGLFNRLGWANLGRVPLVVRLLRTPPQLRRASVLLGPALSLFVLRDRAVLRGRVERLDSFGGWADELWEANATRLGICAVRDATFLQWRFVDAPHPYRRWALIRDPGSSPVGFAVSTVVDWHGVKVAWLMELQLHPESRGGADTLLATVLADARSQGAVAVCAIKSGRTPYAGALYRAGFLRLPRRYASDFSFGVRPLGDAGRSALSAEDWYLSGADFDWL